jgi:integrating conjugative element protein (TIGR03749 family)
LTRYAAQSLYAPLRTVESLPGVRRVPLKLRTELPTLLPTENVSSTPIAAWRLGDYWVTAVKLRNRGSETVQLDPRRLQAKLFAAAFSMLSSGLSAVLKTPRSPTSSPAVPASNSGPVAPICYARCGHER